MKQVVANNAIFLPEKRYSGIRHLFGLADG